MKWRVVTYPDVDVIRFLPEIGEGFGMKYKTYERDKPHAARLFKRKLDHQSKGVVELDPQDLGAMIVCNRIENGGEIV